MKRETVGNYKLGSSLGKGTFGEVKLAVHIPTGQKVAIKILEKDRILQSADAERITRQISILKKLRHPNIIQLYQIMEARKELYLVMQYAEGGQLFDLIVKNLKLYEKRASNFLGQILAGIQYMHDLGIVHRDLKPQNLLLDQDKNLKIVDFGLSNTYKPGQMLKTPCGSPCYAAPEMIANKDYECKGVDIWSAGVITYAMVCGYLPFEHRDTKKLYKKILSGEFQVPDFLSSQCVDLVKKILNVDPQFRYTLQKIRNHPWMKTSIKPNKGIRIGIDEIPVDLTVVSSMESLGFIPKEVVDSVRRNKHNNITTTYYLTQKKLKHEASLPITISTHKQRFSEGAKNPIKINKIKRPQDQSSVKNDSFNGSYILNTLKQTIKSRQAPLPAKARQTYEINKLFPKEKGKQKTDSSFNSSMNKSNYTERPSAPASNKGYQKILDNSLLDSSVRDKSQAQMISGLKKLDFKKGSQMQPTINTQRYKKKPIKLPSQYTPTQKQRVYPQTTKQEFKILDPYFQKANDLPNQFHGPYCLRCISTKSAQHICKSIQNFLSTQKLKFSNSEKFRFDSQLRGERISLQVLRVQGAQGVHYLRIKGRQSWRFDQIIAQL